MKQFDSNILGQGSKGIALITALVMAVFLFVLGIFFSVFMDRDIYFAAKQHNNLDAYFLAYSGMEYYRVTGQTNTIEMPEGNTERRCMIQNVSGDIWFTGIVSSATGEIRAERTLIARGGNLDDWYER